MNFAEQAADSEMRARPNHPWTREQWIAYYHILLVIVPAVIVGLVAAVIVAVVA